jgi:TolB-like protein
MAVAETVCAALEQAGIRCWVAPRDVMPGTLYADAIVRALNDAKAVVILLTENAVASPHVGKEIERSSSKRRPLIALRLDAAPLTPAFEYFLSESQWIDAQSAGVAAVMPRLIQALRQLHAGPSAPGAREAPTSQAASSPPRAAHSSRINTILIAAVALIGLGLVSVLLDKFWLHRTATTAPTPLTSGAISKDSIAVLPFADMSEKKDQEYFSDGLSEELIALLTKIPQLRVPARTSSFYFKTHPEDIPTIAKKLLVAHVLEGSVQKSGDRLRVTAQLIRADNGYDLWSETYDRKLDDVFKLQDEIATAVVGALKVKLLTGSVSAERQTENPEAYNQYLIGHHVLEGGNWVLDKTAVEAFKRALELDPNYAQAWAELATATYWVGEGNLSGEALAAQRQKAVDEASKAIALRPDLSGGFVARGWIRARALWDFHGAQEDFRHALAVDPDNATVLSRYTTSILLPLGHIDEGLADVEKATRADPLNPDCWRTLSIAQTLHGDLQAALVSAQKSLVMSPQQTNAAAFEAYVYLFLKQPALALSVSEGAAPEFQRQVAAMAEHSLGHTQKAQASLDELIAKNSASAAYQIAQVYAWFGERNQTLQWLERAYAQQDAGLGFTKVDPFFSALRSDPRFQALLVKLKLQD